MSVKFYLHAFILKSGKNDWINPWKLTNYTKKSKICIPQIGKSQIQNSKIYNWPLLVPENDL